MDLELHGKRALVSGGSRGIGKAVALSLAREGADVAITARDKAVLEQAAEEIDAAGPGRVFATPVDTADDASVRAMGEAVLGAFGGIDILVNCAARAGGTLPTPRFDGVSKELMFEEIDVKVLGYLRCIQAVAPSMIASGWGRIINVSGLAARSTGSIVGSVRNVAVAAMTKNLADELAPHGINVTVVHPGQTLTERTAEAFADATANNLVGRFIESAEVADVITFLASPKSVAITGDAIAAGGGVARVIYY